MALHKRINRLRRIDGLIRRKATGPASALAKRLKVVRSTVYKDIEILKNKGAQIGYCRHRRSYYYLEEFVLRF